MGDMTAQMDQMNCNALLVNVTFKSDFMKKVFLYNQKRFSQEKKVIKKKEKKCFSTHNALLVNVTFKSDFMKKVFLYKSKKVFSGKKSDQKKKKRNAFLHTMHF